MPTDISTDPLSGIAEMRLRRRVDGAQLIETIRAFFDSPASHLNVIWDASEICSLDLSREEMQNVADILDEILERCDSTKWAVIGDCHESVALTTMLLSTVNSPRQLRLFDDEAAARRWLSEEHAPNGNGASNFHWVKLSKN